MQRKWPKHASEMDCQCVSICSVECLLAKGALGMLKGRVQEWLLWGGWEDINWSHIPSSVYKKYSVKWINKLYLWKAWTEILFIVYFKYLQIHEKKRGIILLSNSLLPKINTHLNLHGMPQMMFFLRQGSKLIGFLGQKWRIF